MTILAVNSQDVFILAAMLTAGALAILGAWRAKLLFVKVGALLSAVMVCLGLAYFGWSPLFGGTHPPGTYFGATMLFLGLINSVIVGTIEESYRRTTGAGAAERRGFTVVPPQGEKGLRKDDQNDS